MAVKLPLCQYSGVQKELQPGDTLPGGGSGGFPDWFAFYKARGQTKAGLTDDEISVYQTDFTNIADFDLTGVAGTRSFADEKGGVLVLSGNNSTSQLVSGDAITSYSRMVKGSEPFYIAGRIKSVAPVTPHADENLLIGFRNGTGGGTVIQAGIAGGVSTTKFSASASGQNLISTVNLDNAWHDIEMWFDGTDFFLSVDDETPVSVTDAGDAVFVAVWLYASHSAAYEFRYDKLLVLTGLPT